MYGHIAWFSIVSRKCSVHVVVFYSCIKIDSEQFAPNTIYVRNKVSLKSEVYIGSRISLEY